MTNSNETTQTEEAIYSKADLHQLREQILREKHRAKLNEAFSDSLITKVLARLLNTLMHYPESDQICEDALEIAFHIAHFGNSDAIRANALGILSLSMDIDAIKKSRKFQLNIFLNLKTMSDQSQRDLSICDAAQSEMAKLLYSELPEISEFVTLYFLDVKSNIHNNISHLNENIKGNPKHVKQLHDNILKTLVHGPKTYITDTKTKSTIKSKEISLLYFTQFVHGQIGLGNKNAPAEVKTAIIEALDQLINDQTLIEKTESSDSESEIKTYFSHLKLSALKGLIKMSEKSINTYREPIQSGNVDLSKDELVDLICFIEDLRKIFEEASSEKMASQIQKMSESLQTFQNEVESYL
jgi:hypothetical protein